MLRRFLDGLYAASLAAAGLFLVGIFALMIGEAVFRKSGSYITGANELIGWFCAAAGFLALPATFKRGDMVRVTYAVDALAPAARKGLLLGCLAVALVFVGYMGLAVGAYLVEGWRSEELTQGMILIPVWIPQSSFLVGVALLFLAVADEFIGSMRTPAQHLRAERSSSPQDASPH
jgi:TRAP-type C4-dicarboxylate transport system permease small subunit